MKLNFALICLIFSPLTLFSQGAEDWKFLREQGGVKVYSQNIDCDKCGPAQEWVVFRLENSNDHDVSASWFYEQWHGGKCFGCDRDPEQFRSLTIPANSSKEGKCGSSHSELSIWVRFHEFQMEDELSDFELADFQVARVD